MNTSYHIVNAEPCEGELSRWLAHSNKWGKLATLTLPQQTANELIETLVRYRSELAELRGRQHPVPASTKATEV